MIIRILLEVKDEFLNSIINSPKTIDKYIICYETDDKDDTWNNHAFYNTKQLLDTWIKNKFVEIYRHNETPTDPNIQYIPIEYVKTIHLLQSEK